MNHHEIAVRCVEAAARNTFNNPLQVKDIANLWFDWVISKVEAQRGKEQKQVGRETIGLPPKK
jgi:hypothetical protein